MKLTAVLLAILMLAAASIASAANPLRLEVNALEEKPGLVSIVMTALDALPGVVAFTQFAARHGIAVIYISNRAKDLDQATLANLRKAGLPVSGPEAFLGLGTFVEGCEQIGTEKGCRRQLVSRKYRVLMQFGDQIGDFVTVSANNAAGRRRAMAPYLDWVGRRWFVLPNPTYGSWEPALFNNDWSASPAERRQQKIDALRTE